MSRLSDLLESLLSVAETWVTTPRAYISHGRPVADCDSLAVYVGAIRATQPNKNVCAVTPLATLHVVRFVCVPTMEEDGSAPPAADLTESALDLADDADSIFYGAVNAWAAGTLFPDGQGGGLVSCSEIDFGDGIAVLEPQGGIGGWDLTIRVLLN